MRPSSASSSRSDEGRLDRVREVAPRLRVEVDAQLVGVVDVAGADRPRVERHGVHLHGPHRPRPARRRRPGGACARRGRCTSPGVMKSGMPLGGFLVQNSSPVMPSGKRWSVTGRSPRARMSPSETSTAYAREVELGDPVVGPDQPVGAGDPDRREPLGSPGDLQLGCLRRHARATRVEVREPIGVARCADVDCRGA